MKFLKDMLKFIVVVVVLIVFVRLILFFTSDSVLEFDEDTVVVIPFEGSIDMETSKHLVNALETYRDMPSVKGIIITVNSPGGGAAASQYMYEYIKNYDKTVFVVMETVAASGGYYMAIAADKIYAMPSTITGSIGVIMFTMNYTKLQEKIGLGTEVIKSGEFKDAGSPARDMTARDREVLGSVIMEMYEQFITDIADSRDMDIETVRSLADGRIYTGNQALELSLIDSIGFYYDAIDDMNQIFEKEMNVHEHSDTNGMPQFLQDIFGLLPFKNMYMKRGFYFLALELV